MESSSYVFQISGMKVSSEKKKIVKAIQQLGGRYIGGSVYQQDSTHVIVPKVLASEKFLAACAAGKWVVHPEYVLDSFKNGSWLEERLYEVAIRPGTPTVFYPVRRWRKRVGYGHTTGAFQGWRVLLIVPEPSRRHMFKRILKAGKAKVYHCPPPPHATITHVLANPFTDNVMTTHNAPCYPLNHIVRHLFGSHCIDMNFKIEDNQPAQNMQANCADIDFSEMQTELRKYVTTLERRTRLFFPEFLCYHGLQHPESQVAETYFNNVGIMIQCGLFFEALDSMRSALFPGLLPPAPYLVSLIDYALKGDATLLFIRNLQQVLHSLLINNTQWRFSATVKKYFSKVLQCPQCKRGIWPFLETAISYCLSREDTCHPLPGRALPTLLCFHSDLLAFVVKLFQGELHTITAGDSLLCRATEVPQVSASSFLLYATFWTMWERSTLLSQAVKKLVQLVVQALVWELASIEDHAESDMRQSLSLAENLMDIMSVLVEFWCHQNIKLNPIMMEKGLKDLAEHIALASHDVSPVVLVALVSRISSPRLKLVTTDAIFKKLCCINGLTVTDEPYSFKNMVSSYLPALVKLGERPRQADLRGPPPRAEPIAHSWMSPGSVSRIQSSSIGETCLGKENVPRGLHRVNAAGETLLHRACKKNHVDTVLQILALPDTDVNVKDHAGWTPLHEACNHGSTACVEALLHHRPAPQLNSQVGGVSPLHDAVLNGHMDIAKMLLQHAGSVLLQQTDGKGRTALDVVSTATQREELIQSAKVGDFVPEVLRSEVYDPLLLEAGSSLLAHLICAYLLEKGLLGRTHLDDKARRLAYKLAGALDTHSLRKVTSGWVDQRAVRLVEDAEALLGLGRGLYLDHMSPVLLGFSGENTRCLMDILENLKAQGEALVASVVNSTM